MKKESTPSFDSTVLHPDINTSPDPSQVWELVKHKHRSVRVSYGLWRGLCYTPTRFSREMFRPNFSRLSLQRVFIVVSGSQKNTPRHSQQYKQPSKWSEIQQKVVPWDTCGEADELQVWADALRTVRLNLMDLNCFSEVVSTYVVVSSLKCIFLFYFLVQLTFTCAVF